ncbi:phage tail protein [Yersinia enterocolitica]|uniref:phage tail protein n=1 Tax=Yersinia enterocolitica TaxID=630 RepID=UPI0038BD29C9
MQKIGDIPNTRADSNGEFTDGNVAGGVPPTILPAAWFNTIQRELMSVLSAAEIDADSTQFNQVLLSIQKLIGEGIPDIKDASLTQKGIVQLSNATNSTSEILAATPKAVRAVDIAALKIAKNLSEIKDAGPAAVAETLLNLSLGDAAKRAIGTDSANVPDIAIADSRYKSIGYTPVLSRVWVSNEYQSVTGTPTIVNHGLTGIDVLHCKADVLLKCIATDLAGYSPGDFAAGWGIHYTNAPLSPIPALSTSTITISSGNAGTGILVSGKGGGPSYAIDTTKWRLIFRIFY